jgi:arylformamidase
VRLIDLSHSIHTGMPIWPGDPPVRLTPAAATSEVGYNLLSLELGSQSGTHVDAPFHVDDRAPTLGELPLERFVGPAVVADLRHLDEHAAIKPDHLEALRGRLAPGVVLLLCTGWSRHWGSPRYADHPWLHPDAASVALAAGIRTVGIDAPSIDRSAGGAGTAPPALETHRILAAEHVVIAENLTRLETLLEPAMKAATITVWLLPLALANADGSPVRAVAQIA